MTRFATLSNFSRLAALVLLTAVLAACSGEDKNSMGPTAEPQPVDEITVTFQSFKAVLDCDGPDNPGDFYYSLNVDTMGADGKFYTASRVGEKSATLHNGVTRIAPYSLKVSVPATQFSEFRVRLWVREDDGATNDFTRSATVRHVFQARTQSWMGNWNESTRSGSQTWGVKLRDQEKNIWGKIVKDGCYFQMKYSVSAHRTVR